MLPQQLLAKGEEIRRLRLERGLSQAELATDASTSQRCISDAENQRGQTETETLLRLSEMLNVELQQIAHVTIEQANRENVIYRASLGVLQVLLKQPDSLAGDCLEVINRRIRSDKRLERYRSLNEKEQKIVWYLLESDMWIETQPNGKFQLRFPPCHAAISCIPQIEFALTETHLKLVTYAEHSTKEKEILDEMGFNLPKIIDRLALRLEYLYKVVTKKSDQLIPDAVVSCDLALTYSNNVLARVIFELSNGVSRFIDYLALHEDDQMSRRLAVLRQFLYLSRFDTLWMYDQVSQAGPDSTLAVEWIQYRPYLMMAAVSILTPPFDSGANQLQLLRTASPLSPEFNKALTDVENLAV